MSREQSWVGDLDGLLRERFKPGDEFTLTDVYAFEPELLRTRPNAQNVRARIRDALQQLRHHRTLEFLEKGRYRLR